MTNQERSDLVEYRFFTTDPTPVFVRSTQRRPARPVRVGEEPGTYVRFSTDPNPVFVPDRRRGAS